MRRRVFSIFVVLACFLNGTILEAKDLESKEEVTLSPSNYEKEISKGLIIVDFWAPWCGPCRKMEPVLKSIASEKIRVAKLNIDTYQSFAVRQQGVNSIPTIKIYKDGKQVERLVGVFTKEEFLEVLKPYM